MATNNKISNVDMLNAIRNESSSDYKERIPSATTTNLQEILSKLTDYPMLQNEFISALVNKIGKTIFLNKVYTNPYKFFKKGKLEYGKSIESIFVDLAERKDFSQNFGDNEVTSLISKEDSKLLIEYYTENYQNKYKVSLSSERLRGAFTSQYGLDSLINNIFQSALNSKEYDEFLLVKTGISHAPLKEIKLAENYSTLDEDKQAKALYKKAKAVIMDMGLMGNKYNSKGIYTFSRPSELVILVTPTTKANIDVELLSSAFNMTKADIEGRMILIDEFTKFNTETQKVEVDENVEMIICDEELIQLYDTLDTSESFRNADTLTTNTFFHDWGILGVCSFVNGVKIVK